MSDELIAHWDFAVVFLSVIIAFCGAYMTVSIAELFISIEVDEHSFKNHFLLLCMAVSTGGVSIWCMRQVAMGAVIFETSAGVYIPISHDVGMTFIAFLCAVVMSFAGLYVATLDSAFAKDMDDVFEMILMDASRESLAGVRDKDSLMRIVLLKGMTSTSIVAGGVLIGGGISLMHYIGMLAMRGDFELSWKPALVVASVVLACFVGSAGVWLIFRLLALYPTYESLRVIASIVIAAAVTGSYCISWSGVLLHGVMYIVMCL